MQFEINVLWCVKDSSSMASELRCKIYTIYPILSSPPFAWYEIQSAVSYMSHIAPICLPQVGRDPEVMIISGDLLISKIIDFHLSYWTLHLIIKGESH